MAGTTTIVVTYTSPGACACCTPTGCLYQIPLFSGTYPDLATATAAITNQTGNCLVYSNVDGTTVTSRTLSGTIAGNILTASDVIVWPFAPGWADNVYCSFYATAAYGVNITYNFAWSGVGSVGHTGTLSLLDNTGTLVGSNTVTSVPASGSFSKTIPSDGYYYFLAITSVNGGTPGTMTNSYTVDVGGNGSFCTVEAAYTSGGGTLFKSCP